MESVGVADGIPLVVALVGTISVGASEGDGVGPLDSVGLPVGRVNVGYKAGPVVGAAVMLTQLQFPRSPGMIGQ
jgi:hypothetical protein